MDGADSSTLEPPGDLLVQQVALGVICFTLGLCARLYRYENVEPTSKAAAADVATSAYERTIAAASHAASPCPEDATPPSHAAPPCPEDATPPMRGPLDLIEFMREFWVVRESGDVDRTMSYCSDDVVWALGPYGSVTGKDAVRKFFVKGGAAKPPDVITPWTLMQPPPDLPSDHAIVFRESKLSVMMMTLRFHQEFTIRDVATPMPKIIRMAIRKM